MYIFCCPENFGSSSFGEEEQGRVSFSSCPLCPQHAIPLLPSLSLSCSFCSTAFEELAWEKEGKHLKGFASSKDGLRFRVCRSFAFQDQNEHLMRHRKGQITLVRDFWFWILCSLTIIRFFVLFLLGKQMLCSCLACFLYLGKREVNSPVRRDAFEDTAR